MLKAVLLADILKVSETEMELLTGEHNPEKGSHVLHNMGPSLVFITLGEAGCFFRCRYGTGIIRSYPVNAIDTTGAGDAFMAGILYQITKQEK